MTRATPRVLAGSSERLRLRVAGLLGLPLPRRAAYQSIDEELVGRWARYAEAGGHLILTARAGRKKRNGQLWEARRAEPVYKLIDAEVAVFDLLLEDGSGEVTMNGEQHQ